jgi:serine/threonine protein kinase
MKANFVINPQTIASAEQIQQQQQQQPLTVYIIDFGLARRYILPNGEIRPPRQSAGFRGTVRYASINSHEMQELGPHDDLWSIFYSLVEFATGVLPWMNMRDKSQVLAVKKRFTNESLVDGLPQEFLLFMKYLQTMKYGEIPDYKYLKGLLVKICNVNGYQMDDLYDWQQKSLRAGIRDPEHQSSAKSITMNVSGSAVNDANFYNIVRANADQGRTGSISRGNQYPPDNYIANAPENIKVERKDMPHNNRMGLGSERDRAKKHCSRCSVM